MIWILPLARFDDDDLYFMSLSTLSKSYRDDERMMMKRSVQWSSVQSWYEFWLQWDSNRGPYDLKSEILMAWPQRHFKQLVVYVQCILVKNFWWQYRNCCSLYLPLVSFSFFWELQFLRQMAPLQILQILFVLILAFSFSFYPEFYWHQVLKVSLFCLLSVICHCNSKNTSRSQSILWSWTSMVFISLETWKFVLHMGSLSHWGLIIVQCTRSGGQCGYFRDIFSIFYKILIFMTSCSELTIKAWYKFRAY